MARRDPSTQPNTGTTATTSLRLRPVDLQKLEDLIADHEEETGVSTNRTALLRALIDRAHRNRSKTRKAKPTT